MRRSIILKSKDEKRYFVFVDSIACIEDDPKGAVVYIAAGAGPLVIRTNQDAAKLLNLVEITSSLQLDDQLGR